MQGFMQVDRETMKEAVDVAEELIDYFKKRKIKMVVSYIAMNAVIEQMQEDFGLHVVSGKNLGEAIQKASKIVEQEIQ